MKIVITAISGSSFKTCIDYYTEKNFRKYRFFFLLISFDHYDYEVIDLNRIVSSFIPLEYQQNTSYYNNYAFKQRTSNILKPSFFITPIYEACNTALNIYKNAVLNALDYDSSSNNSWPDIEYVRLSIPNSYYSSAGGEVTITVNNFANRPMYLMEIENNNFIQLNPMLGETKSYDPFPFVSYTPKESENTKDVHILELNKIEIWVSITLCIISIIFTMVCLFFTIKYRERKIIKCCSALYYYCLLLSLVISAGSVITLTLTPTSSSYLCYLRINACLFSVVLVSSLLFTKAAKYNFSRRKKIHKVYIYIVVYYYHLDTYFIFQYNKIICCWLYCSTYRLNNISNSI